MFGLLTFTHIADRYFCIRAFAFTYLTVYREILKYFKFCCQATFLNLKFPFKVFFLVFKFQLGLTIQKSYMFNFL